jgi:cell division ATPase FtsA
MFEFALSEIKRSGYAGSLGAGVVITGGTALIRGVEELATEIFNMPVKIGMPKGISYSGLVPEITSPVYSTAVGLALFGIDSNDNMRNFHKSYKSADSEPAKAQEYHEEKQAPKKKEKNSKENEESIFVKAKNFFDKL